MLRCTLSLVVFCLILPAASAQITVRFLEPGVQASPVAGAQVATFDALTPGAYSSVSTSIGTYTAGTNDTELAPELLISAATVFTGAGDTNSLVVPGSRFATLDLTGPAGYFGLYLTAADTSNRFDFFRNSGSEPVFSFRFDLVVNSGLLSGTPGTTDGHYGRPDAPFLGENNAEPYLFLQFFADTESTKFDRVVLTQLGVGGLESDNHTVFGDLISAGDQSGTIVPIPEPFGVLLAAGAALGLWRRRRG